MFVSSVALAAAAFGTFLVYASDKAVGTPRFAQLLLRETHTHRLPDAFALDGAASTSSGALVLWSSKPGILLLIKKGRQVPIDASGLSSVVGAAFVAGDSVIEAVDGGRRAVVRVSDAGEVTTTWSLDIPITVESAVRGANEWFVGGRTDAGQTRVYSAVEGSGTRLIHSVDGRRGQNPVRRFHLSAAGADVLLMMTEAPFTTFHLAERGSIRSFAPEAHAPLGALLNDSTRRWVALRTVPLDRGYLQTIADVRSDKRLMVLYDRQGRVVRHQVLEAPIGFLGAIPSNQKLLAARWVSSAEVVEYQWQWE